MFHDWGTWDRAVSQIQAHAAWWDGGGTSQAFVDHGLCRGNQIAQRADACPWCAISRHHIRLHPIDHDPFIGWTTVGDAHHEEVTWCGHVVNANGSNGSGFDQGRRQLRIRFENAGHGWYSTFWGNTQNMQQCDGRWARSDGYTVFIRLHQLNH